MKNIYLALTVIIFIIGGVFVAKAAGLWITESTKTPVTYSSGEFEGLPNPADIRGSYSLADVEAAFNIPVDILAQAFSLSEADPNFRINGLEEIYESFQDGGELGTDSVRLFVSLYLGLPYTPEETTRLAMPAVDLLSTKLMPADLDLVRARAVNAGTVEVTELPDGQGEIEEENEYIVKGNTSFYDLLQWGLSEEEIVEVLGIPMGMSAENVKNFLMANEMEFAIYKVQLQELVDSKQ